VANIATATDSIVVSKLRPPFLSDRSFFANAAVRSSIE
jgi:hypothetical protein